MGNFVDIRNTSVKVFIIVWGLIKHAGHLVLMILKQYLLTKSPEDKEFIHYSTALGRVSRRTGNTIRAQDGFGYANSHTPSLPEQLTIVFILMTISSIKISPSVETFQDPFLQGALALHSACYLNTSYSTLALNHSEYT